MISTLLLGIAVTIHFQTADLTNATINATINATTSTAISTTLPSPTTAVLPTTSLPCQAPCTCFKEKGLLAMRCLLKDLPHEGWKIPRAVKSLILSDNGLNQVPTGFFRRQNLSHLLSLSLCRNNITKIQNGAFDGLSNLTILDLSFTNLRSWSGSVNLSLPSLKTLDTTGNPWLPTANVLLHPTLQFVSGVSWSSMCFNCTLMNIANIPKPNRTGGVTPPTNDTVVVVLPSQSTTPIANMTLPIPSGPPDADMHPPSETSMALMGSSEYEVGPPVDLTSPTEPVPIPGMGNQAFEFQQLGYFPQCSNFMACIPKFYPVATTSPLISLPSRLFYVAYVLGAVAVALNFCIIFIYFYSNTMRKVNSMLLITNMAVCDVLVGIYCIIIGKINIFNVLMNDNSDNNETLMFTRLCPVASVLFTLGQIVSVFTGLLLTIDKYLSIVYCMDPNRKISRRLSMVVLALCWVATLIYGLSPSFDTYPDLVWSPVLMCTLPVTEQKGIIVCFALLILLYLANIPFYGKIFLFVRRSSARMGVRRDAILAKKIALLIFTNFVFFVIPMTILIVYIFLRGIHFLLHVGSVDDPDATQKQYIISYWLPVTFLGINSCLNPFLCAFRQRQFRREVRKCVRNCVLSYLCKAFTTIRSDSSLRTAPATRVEMYKLSKAESQVN